MQFRLPLEKGTNACDILISFSEEASSHRCGSNDSGSGNGSGCMWIRRALELTMDYTDCQHKESKEFFSVLTPGGMT